MLKKESNIEEKNRLNSLLSYGILDTPAEEDYDNITQLAAEICGTPIALISLVDSDRQWFKSKVGTELSELPRETSFCTHTIEKPNELLIVDDAQNDEKFKNNPLVTGFPGVGFYAGVPLVDKNNYALGTLCVIDYHARKLTSGQIKALKTLAKSIVQTLELFKTNLSLKRKNELIVDTLRTTNPLFILLNHSGEIIDFGLNLKKVNSAITVEKPFTDFFEFENTFNLGEFLNSGEITNDKLLFFHSPDKTQKFKFSVQVFDDFVMLSPSPVVNTQYSLHNYNLTLNDFAKHDYIAEYLFLQQTTARSMADSKNVVDKIVTKNKRLILLENFLGRVSEGIEVFDASGVMVYANKTALERHDINAAQISNLHISDFQPDFKDPQKWNKEIEFLKFNGIKSIEIQDINKKTGNTYFLEINAKHEFIQNNDYVIVTYRDITERKKTASELVNTKLKLESILNEMTDALWSLSLPDFMPVLATPSLEKIYEVPRKHWDKEGRWWKNMVHPEDAHYIEDINNVILKNGFCDLTYRIICPGGNIKWINNKGKVVYDENGQSIRIDGTVTDVTNIQLAFEMQKRFVKEAPTAIAMLDTKMNYIAASDKWIADYNLPLQIGNLNYYDSFPTVSDEWKTIHQNCLNGSSFYKEEDKFIFEDGREVWLKWIIKPWYNEKSEIGGIILLTEDITRIKVSKEEELKQILKLTQLQNNRLQNFAHIVSHNLRSHSGNIKSLIDLLMEEKPEIREDDLVLMIKQSSENLMETISHLSEVAMMNVKENELLSELNISVTLEKAIENVSALAKNSSVQIINNLSGDEIIQGIPAYLDSILLNFLTNGIKYRSTERDSFIKISSEQIGDFVMLAIEDNGLGIDLKKNGNKLFGMYKTFHKHSDSRGIGLFITKNQIESMGGRIEVESEVGVGTTFKIFFKSFHEK